ncbi:MAG: ATP-binding cassette domain-containing protein [Chlamydiota bacterium]
MIIVKDLYKNYGKNEVLKGLSIEIQKGETLVILGRSGVGKSVLLKHLMGIEKPDQGTINIDGIEITSTPKSKLFPHIKHMGMLFQGSALFDSMTVEENVGFYLSQHKNPKTNKPYTKKEMHEKVLEALSMFGLEGSEKKMPSDLSGGMKKRAGIARLLIYRPDILLYDEPTTGLDPITAEQINALIIKTQKELKGTSIIVTHDLHSALYVGDRLALHEDGKILYVEKPEKFLEINHPTITFMRNTIKNTLPGRNHVRN